MKLFAALVLLLLVGLSAQQSLPPIRSWRTSHYDKSLNQFCYLNSMCRPNSSAEELGFRMTITDAFYYEKSLVMRVHLYKTRQEGNMNQRLLTTFVQLTQIDFEGDLNNLVVRVGSAREWPLSSRREIDNEKFYYLERKLPEEDNNYQLVYFFGFNSNYLQVKHLTFGPTTEISTARTFELVGANGTVNRTNDLGSLSNLVKEFTVPLPWFTREQFYDNSYGQFLAIASIPMKIELDVQQEAATFAPFNRSLALVYFREYTAGNTIVDWMILANLVNESWFWPHPEVFNQSCNTMESVRVACRMQFTHPRDDVKLIAVSAIRPLIVRKRADGSIDDFYFFVLEFYVHRDYPNQHLSEGTLILLRKIEVIQFDSNMWRLGENDARQLPIPNGEMVRFFGCPFGLFEKPEVPSFSDLDFIVPFNAENIYLPSQIVWCALLENSPLHPFGTVDCSNRNYDRVPSGFDSRTTRALISANRIQRLDNLELANCGLWNTSTIDLDHNRIHFVGDLAFVNLRATHLYLRHNRLVALNHVAFRRASSLTHLYLDNNNFGLGNHQINLPLAGLHRVTYISMTSCTMNQTHFVAGNEPVTGARLQTLDLGHNLLQRLPTIGRIDSLQRLNVDGNRFVTLTSDQFQHYSGRTRIDLRDNRLQNMADAAFTVQNSELILDMANNHLDRTPFNGNIRLNVSTIILAHNRISRIGSNWLHLGSRFRVVDFSHNAITDISTIAFEPFFGTLQYVNLSSNLLFKIDMRMFASGLILPPTATSLKPAVNLANNSLHCDCSDEMIITVRFYHYFEAGQSPVCSTGQEEVRGMTFEQVKLGTTAENFFYPDSCIHLYTGGSGPMSQVQTLSFWAVVCALLLVGVSLVAVCVLFVLRTKESID